MKSIGRRRDVNVGETERAFSMLAGAALAVFGLSRRNARGLLPALAGFYFLDRGATGNCRIYRRFNVRTAGQAQYVKHGIKVSETTIIDRPSSDLFGYWRNFENLPKIMSHLKEVTPRGGNLSHWVARGPLGTSVEWDAEVIREFPNELITWQSLDSADVIHAGSVSFHKLPGDRGTEVKVILRYDPPAGRLGAALSSFLGENPAKQIREDLRKFKQLLEAGETATAG